MDMEIDAKQPLYFKKPDGIDLAIWSGRIGSLIACARKHVKGSAYAKRMVEFDGESGIAVWRKK